MFDGVICMQHDFLVAKFDKGKLKGKIKLNRFKRRNVGCQTLHTGCDHLWSASNYQEKISNYVLISSGMEQTLMSITKFHKTWSSVSSVMYKIILLCFISLPQTQSPSLLLWRIQSHFTSDERRWVTLHIWKCYQKPSLALALQFPRQFH